MAWFRLFECLVTVMNGRSEMKSKSEEKKGEDRGSETRCIRDSLLLKVEKRRLHRLKFGFFVALRQRIAMERFPVEQSSAVRTAILPFNAKFFCYLDKGKQ